MPPGTLWSLSPHAHRLPFTVQRQVNWLCLFVCVHQPRDVLVDVFQFVRSLNVAVHLLMESMTLLMPNRRAGELADMSARPGWRLQTDIINQPSATGQSNKMANGSVGAEKPLQTQTTKKNDSSRNICTFNAHIFYSF